MIAGKGPRYGGHGNDHDIRIADVQDDHRGASFLLVSSGLRELDGNDIAPGAAAIG